VSYLCGLDLGQQKDYTALAIAEYYRPDGAKRLPLQYDVRHIERVPLGTSYPVIVNRVHTLLDAPRLQGHVKLIVDGTGVGRPVIDMLCQEGLNPVAVSIHGGDAVSRETRGCTWYRVPKRDLIGVVQVALHAQRLRIAAAHPMASTLIAEMQNYRVKIDPNTAHDSYSTWREGVHDDLVLACALACWYGEWRDTHRMRTL
jgi:hypothetical protein